MHGGASTYNALAEARPDADIRIIPVGPIIAKLLSSPPFDQIPATELFVDGAPHGTPTTYFLAGLVSYMVMYGEKPPADFDIPSDVNSIVAENYQLIVDFIWEEVSTGEFSLECFLTAVLGAARIRTSGAIQIRIAGTIRIRMPEGGTDTGGSGGMGPDFSGYIARYYVLSEGVSA